MYALKERRAFPRHHLTVKQRGEIEFFSQVNIDSDAYIK